MDSKEYSIDWVAETIDDEGIGYALLHYFDLNDIEDAELRKLCLEAERALEAVQGFVSSNRTDQ